jgi:alkylation response protein AidB-like acyl-CoA dehydrogenase
MSNFYRDNQDILFHMQNMDFSDVVKMKEGDFSEKTTFPEAPVDLADAVDNYDRVLEIIGDIAGEFIAPRAADVDKEGATFANGEVSYAKGTVEAIDRLKKADLMGVTLPRRFGGLNLPKTIYSIMIEIVSRADASLMNIFGLQEISETIYKFGTEDQKQRYLPRFCRGEVLGAMALTEPDAGSDLQVVRLKAYQKEDGNWYLNGVKRFITNGCAEISLVMARSEEGSTGGRGLSLFIYEREKQMQLRRIEEKLGIHGSPTCEMQFNDAPTELLGQRKFGLIKYTMSLMNGARLAVAAQAVGIAEAAYRAANEYAATRLQFGGPIKNLTAVYEMLTDMKIAIEASRTFLYEASRIVDIKEGLEELIEKHPERKNELQDELKRYTKYAALFTPALKAYTTEMGNKVCYDALQVHGGSGYTQDFAVERHVRDVRVTNIYEGTTQLQIIAAIGSVVSGTVFERLDEYEKSHDFASIAETFSKAKTLRKYLEDTIVHVKNRNDKLYQEYHERRLVELANDTIIAYLLCIDALKSDRKKILAHCFIAKALPKCKAKMEYILSNDTSVLEFHETLINN